MRSKRLATLTVLLVAGSMAASVAEDRPSPQWSPEEALVVPLSRFTVSNVSLLTALKILDNECGLVFTFVGLGPWRDHATNITLNLERTTVGEVVNELKSLASGQYVVDTVEGVVTVTPRTLTEQVGAFLEQTVSTFSAQRLRPPELKAAIVELLNGLEALPPVATLAFQEEPAPVADWRVENESLPVLLRKAAASINQSCIYTHLTEWQVATFGMERGWALPLGTKFDVRLAADARKEPDPTAPTPPAVVRQHAKDLIVGFLETTARRNKAVADMIELISSLPSRRKAFAEVETVIGLLGESQAEEAAEALALIVDFSAYGESRRCKWMQAREGGANTKEESFRQLYRSWLSSHPVLEALKRLGPAAAPAIIGVLAKHLVEPVPNALTGSTSPEECEGKTLLLCESLKRLLGTEGAIQRLRAAASEEKDAARARGLLTAALWIEEGLPPVRQ